MIKTRLLIKEDIDACISIWKRNHNEKYTTEDDVRKDLNAMFNSFWLVPEYWVITRYDEVIGFIGFCEQPMDYDCFGFYWLNIDPNFQKFGYGIRLIKAAVVSILKRLDGEYGCLMGTCRPELRSFYQKLGMTTISKKGLGQEYIVMHEVNVDNSDNTFRKHI